MSHRQPKQPKELPKWPVPRAPQPQPTEKDVRRLLGRDLIEMARNNHRRSR